MVRVVRLERTVSWSQTRRDTNFAIPGYSISAIIPRRGGKSKIFCLWSFLWSKPLLRHFLQPGEIQQTQVLQGFAAFRLTLSRIAPRHSQSRRATNCATPGYVLFGAAACVCTHLLKGNGASCRVRFPRSRSAAARAFRRHRRQTHAFSNLRKIKFNTFFRNPQRFSALQFWGGCGMLYK